MPPQPLTSSSRFLTILDSQSLHSTVILYDPTDVFHSRLDPLKPDKVTHILWALTDKHSDSPSPDGENMDSWISTGTVPPDPRSASPWNLTTLVPRQPYEPTLDSNMLLLFPQQNIAPPRDTTSFLLLPQFFPFPLGSSLPIGLVLDPKHMNSRKFHNLVAFLLGHTALNRTQWLSNVFVDAWFAAVRTHPENFKMMPFLTPSSRRLFPPTDHKPHYPFASTWNGASQLKSSGTRLLLRPMAPPKTPVPQLLLLTQRPYLQPTKTLLLPTLSATYGDASPWFSGTLCLPSSALFPTSFPPLFALS
jgi:hypothetical protein